MEKKPSSTAVELPTVVHSAALPGRVTEAQTGSEKPPISAEEYYQNYKEIWKEGIHLVSRSDGLSSWRQLVAELWGTMLLVFFGTGAAITSSTRFGWDAGAIVATALAFGFVVGAMVYATANTSGGHLNPAITIGVMLVGRISVLKAFLYICAQVLGAIVGSAFVMGVIPQNLGNALHYGANAVQTNGVWNFHGQTLAFTVEIYQAVLLEIVLGFSLVLVVLTTVKLARDPYHQSGFAPLAIAFTITIGHLVGIPLTGTSMNPARSFGPAVISGYWDDHWVWWVSPIVGAVFAALVYKSSFLTPVKEN